MKKLIFIVAMFLTLASYAQYPIIEEFDPSTTWTYTNGAGLQNYGPPENYATTNIGLTPYPNGATVTITSPIYDFTSTCGSDITISFPVNGIIEDGWDWLYVEYFDGVSWVNLGGFTGSISGVYTNTTIPNTATQFRFRLETDATVNTYTTGPPGPPTTNVYYYDITNYSIDCITPLPVEFLSFSISCSDFLWATASEYNNSYFTIYHSYNAEDWEEHLKVNGHGTTEEFSFYDVPFQGPNGYYKLAQTDFNGNTANLAIAHINCINHKHVPISGVFTIDYKYLGKKFPTKSGLYIIKYEDGSIYRRGVIK